jgi:4-hydroxybenzoate polyprenyltransferase
MLKLILKTMRPRQWTKNLVIFAGLIFDRQLFNADSVVKTTSAVLLFCLVSGITYIINDLLDIESDRLHPQKKLRPLASGQLSQKAAITFTILLALVTFPAAFFLSTDFGVVCLAYFLLMLVYSKWLKNIPLIDVITIALGFVLRVAGGILVIKVAYLSPWLFVLTSLLALFLGFGKRRAELVLLNDQASSHRKVLQGYTIPLLDDLILVVLSATLIIYCLYTFSASVTPQSHAMMLTIPFVLYGLLRYLYLLRIKEVGGAPEEVLLTDRPIQITLILWALAVVIILYLLN